MANGVSAFGHQRAGRHGVLSAGRVVPRRDEPDRHRPAGCRLCIFAVGRGTSQSTAPTLNFTLDQPYTLVASFTADSDGDGLPDEWELAYFGNLAQGPNDDPDGDGRTNAEEFANGTNPTVADILRITSLELTNNTAILSISNNSGTRYSVQVATNLSGPWSTVATTQYLPRSRRFGANQRAVVLALAAAGRPADVPAFCAGVVDAGGVAGHAELFLELSRSCSRTRRAGSWRTRTATTSSTCCNWGTW